VTLAALRSYEETRLSTQITPESRRISLPVTVRRNGFCPDPVKLKRELSKKYPIGRIQLRARNPPEPDGSIRLFIVVYLVKEVFGPTLRQMVKDAYAYAKRQMSKKKGGKRLATPPRAD
jgi:hypothetical protein